MITLLCVRHGETDANRAGRWQGHDDVPLNATGRAQATAAVPALARLGIRAVLASDLARARETAAPIAAQLGLPVQERPGLREIDVGSWAGLDRHEVLARDPEGAHRHSAGGTGWTDGETYEMLQVRIGAELEAVAHALPDGSIAAVFTHGGVIRALAAVAMGIEAREARLRLGTPVHVGLTVLTIGTRWRLESYNAPLVDDASQVSPPDERREHDDASPRIDEAY
jgi:broad specificity phosphatase PhoE